MTRPAAGQHTQRANQGAHVHPSTPHGLRNLLIGVCAAVWITCAITPWDLSAWLLEQVATVAALVTLVWLGRHVKFSHTSAICVAAMFCLHTIGTHFTYSLTPYDAVATTLFGSGPGEWFDWQRNHYDRFVHFAYGFCMAVPTWEALSQKYGVSAMPVRFMSLNLIVSTSALYELLEWSAALVFGGDAAVTYLGAQGDPWDAQADIALGGAGFMAAYPLLMWRVRAAPVTITKNRGPTSQQKS